MAVNSGFAEDNPELVARTLAAHIEATDWILDAVENQDTNEGEPPQPPGHGRGLQRAQRHGGGRLAEHMTLLYEMNEQLKDYLVNFTNEFISLNQFSMGKVTDRGYSSVENFIDVFVDDTYLNMAGNLTKVNSTVGTVRLGYLLGDLHQFARVVASNVTMWDDTAFAGKSMFAQWGVNIDSPSPYANGAFVMEAFANDAIDMGYLGSPPAIVRHLNVNTENSDIRIVAQVNVEGSAIIVNADIQSIEDLGGKTLGTPGPGSIQHLMLLAFAQEHGFKVKLAGT